MDWQMISMQLWFELLIKYPLHFYSIYSPPPPPVIKQYNFTVEFFIEKAIMLFFF